MRARAILVGAALLTLSYGRPAAAEPPRAIILPPGPDRESPAAREESEKRAEKEREPPPDLATVREWRRTRNSGIVLTAIGGGGLLLGAWAFAISNPGPSHDNNAGGFALMGMGCTAVGGLLFAIGVPVLISALASPKSRPAPVRPSFAVGPRGASLSLSF